MSVNIGSALHFSGAKYENKILLGYVAYFWVLMFFACKLLVTADLVWYAYNICSQICSHMNISCFRVSSPAASPSISETALSTGAVTSSGAAMSQHTNGRKTVVDHQMNRQFATHAVSHSRSSSSDSTDSLAPRPTTRSSTASSVTRTLHK